MALHALAEKLHWEVKVQSNLEHSHSNYSEKGNLAEFWGIIQTRLPDQKFLWAKDLISFDSDEFNRTDA